MTTNTLSIIKNALESARFLCANHPARPVLFATATNEPTEWDDMSTLVDVAVDLIDWSSIDPSDADVDCSSILRELIYGTPTPYGTSAVRHDD
jgi:hypothetical protein